MGQGDWTLEGVPSGKGIIKAHSTILNYFLHTLNINKHDSWDITKNMINDKVNSLTQKIWNSNRHAHTDLILGNHHTKTLKILTNNLNNRTRYRTGICIITGHIGLNKHLHRINRSDTSNCPTVPTLRKQ